MRCNSHGLVDDNEVFVIQQDFQAFHNFLHHFKGVTPVGNRDVKNRAGHKLCRFTQGRTAARNVAFGDQQCRGRPGYVQ